MQQSHVDAYYSTNKYCISFWFAWYELFTAYSLSLNFLCILWTLTKAQRGARQKSKERTENINQITVLDAITCLQVGTSMYWFLQLSFCHIRRYQNNPLGQFILFAALVDRGGKRRLRKGTCKGVTRVGKGGAGKHDRSSRSASSLLLPAHGGPGVLLPALLDVRALRCHMPLTHTDPAEISAPGLPNPFPSVASSILHFVFVWEGEIS